MFPPQSTAASNEKIHKVKLNFMRESMCVREREMGENLLMEVAIGLGK